MSTTQDQREYYRRRKSALIQDRQPYEAAWRELSDNFAPFRGRWTGESAQQKRPKTSRKIIDPTPLLAARTAASGMLAGFTSPSRVWFRAITRDIKLRENKVVSKWLDEVTRLLYDTFAGSNFYNVMPQTYEEAVVFGTGAVLVLPDPVTIVRFFPITINSYAIATNEDNVVDTIYRDITMTARSVARMFGESNCSDRIKSLLKTAPDTLVAVTHSIEPRETFNRALLGTGSMPFVSCWWETDGAENKVLRMSGFPRFPVMVPRWSVNETDAYGYGAGSLALGMAKDLQLSSRRKQQTKDKMTNPTLLAPSTLRNRTISQTSGDIVYFDAAGSDSPTVKPMHLIDPRSVQVLMEDIDGMKEGINHAFYVDLFLMLTMSDRRQFTAREVEERHEEKLLMLAPVLERFEAEMLDVAIELTFDELVRRGRMPPPPRELDNPESIEIEYISILSQAQRAVGMGGNERLYQTAGAIAQMTGDVSVWDKIDTDQLLDETAAMAGSTPTILRDDEEVKAIRANRAKVQQQAQQAQLQQQQADTAKTLSETKTPEGSALDQLTQPQQELAPPAGVAA